MKKTDNPIDAIRADIEAKELTAGLLVIKSANDAIAAAKLLPDPVKLYNDLIIEGEITCLFGDAGCGKTILAVQIGEEIAQTQNVLYADFELSDKQFQRRYTGINGMLHEFPKTFYRAVINSNILDPDNFEDVIFANIDAAAEKVNAKVIIIDNLTYLCNASEKGETASRFMKKILAKKAQGWTVLVVAHTPKRSMFYPMTQNDLAGSKRLMNFFDSAFCIGQSAKDSHIRYIKQVKVRSADMKYDADNVMLFQIGMEGNALRIEKLGLGREREHLKTLSDDELENLEQNIMNLHLQGLSYREIQQELGVSKSKVGRILNNKDTDDEQI